MEFFVVPQIFYNCQRQQKSFIPISQFLTRFNIQCKINNYSKFLQYFKFCSMELFFIYIDNND